MLLRHWGGEGAAVMAGFWSLEKEQFGLFCMGRKGSREGPHFQRPFLPADPGCPDQQSPQDRAAGTALLLHPRPCFLASMLASPRKFLPYAFWLLRRSRECCFTLQLSRHTRHLKQPTFCMYSLHTEQGTGGMHTWLWGLLPMAGRQ